MVPEIMIGRSTPSFLEHTLHGENRRLGVEGVEDGLDQDHVRAAFDQAPGGFAVVLRKSSKVMLRKPGLLTSGDSEQVRLVGPRTPATKRGLIQAVSNGVGHLAGQPGGFHVQLAHQRLHAVVGLATWWSN